MVRAVGWALKTMRQLAALLMALGVILGVAVGLGLMLGLTVPGLPWLVTVGLVKLTLTGSLGLIAGGAVLRRFAIRSEQRDAERELERLRNP